MGSQVETLIRSTVTKGVEALAAFNCRRLPQPADHAFLAGIHRPMTEGGRQSNANSSSVWAKMRI
jgi:carotenoid cleavage dioxygenase